MEENAAFLLEKFMDVKNNRRIVIQPFDDSSDPSLWRRISFQRSHSEDTIRLDPELPLGNFGYPLFGSVPCICNFMALFPVCYWVLCFGYMLVWSGSIWVPVVAHFFNNAAGVIGLYLINKGTISPEMEDIGSGTAQLPFAIVSIVLTSLLLTYMYRQTRRNTIVANRELNRS